MKTKAYAALSATTALEPFEIDRREPGGLDVAIDLLFCGVCHSDIHQARGEWNNSQFPMVPGHEIIGRVARVGDKVTAVKAGDLVGVGCMVDSCRTCGPCRRDHEQFCEAGTAWTYNSTEMDRTTPTQGGYSQHVVVTERFVAKLPTGLDPAAAAPLLCAGITTYSPLRQWGCKPGDRVAVVGLGGLGHMAVKLAAALGADVTVLSTSAAKAADARRLGASAFVDLGDAGALDKIRDTIDLVIDTVSAPHDHDALLRLLRPYGAMALVGMPPRQGAAFDPFLLVDANRRLAGSSIGGMKETRDMLAFCAQHGIVSDIELIPIRQINQAFERVSRSDVRYRFVIDIASLG
jgi:alcohol dehydrogenase (NADP+)